MKVGRTIAEERERLESESERIAAREKVKSRQKYVVIFYVLAVAIIAVLISNGVKSLIEHVDNNNVEVKTVEPKAEIIDESGAGIPKRTKEYIGQLEQDFSELGYTVTRVAVPADKQREIDVYLDGVDYYLKINIDRGTGVSVEDADRMIRYVKSIGVSPGYVDVRVEGKGYYK